MEAALPSTAELGALSPLEQIRYAREIVRLEGQALLGLATRLDMEFCRAVDCLFNCRTSAIVTGMGKAGLIGQKIAATLGSTGTRSHFLHPAEAFHGDLGRIHRDDVVLVLSQSGETEEITRLLPPLSALGVKLIAITADRGSTLARAATVVLALGPLKEACALGLAPSTSTTAMLALGDALALVVSRMRSFGPEDFARFHPGGSLGRKLSKVEDHMRRLTQCRVASDALTVRSVLAAPAPAGRRSGAILLLDAAGRLSGIFTDSDLARLFESRRDTALDEPIRNVMTARPITVPAGSMVSDAMAIMAERKLSELPILDDDARPIGLLDITDLVGRDVSAASAGAAANFARPAQDAASSVPRPKLFTQGGTRPFPVRKNTSES
jgi:arabinose-5-phosphate isomerase